MSLRVGPLITGICVVPSKMYRDRMLKEGVLGARVPVVWNPDTRWRAFSWWHWRQKAPNATLALALAWPRGKLHYGEAVEEGITRAKRTLGRREGLDTTNGTHWGPVGATATDSMMRANGRARMWTLTSWATARTYVSRVDDETDGEIEVPALGEATHGALPLQLVPWAQLALVLQARGVVDRVVMTTINGREVEPEEGR